MNDNILYFKVECNRNLYMSNQKKQTINLTNNKEFRTQNKFKKSKSTVKQFNQPNREFNINNKIQNKNKKDKNYLTEITEEPHRYGSYDKYSHIEDYNINSNRIRRTLNIKNIHNKNDNVLQYNEQNEQNELILKIFIYIYYYEKALSEKNIFIKSIENYYLINPSWLDEFKNFYFYNKLKTQLDLGNKYDYNNIDLYINDIINEIPEKAKLKYQSLPKILKTNILSTQRGIIFPQKMMNIIYELDRDFLKNTKPSRFIFKNINIYYISHLISKNL